MMESDEESSQLQPQRPASMNIAASHRKNAELLQAAMAMFLPAFKIDRGITDRSSDILLNFMNVILNGVNHEYPRFATLPKSIKTVLSRFDNTDDHIIQYTVCRSCHCLYDPLPKIVVSNLIEVNHISILISSLFK